MALTAYIKNSYPLPKIEGEGLCMLGGIYSNQKCPACNSKFIDDDSLILTEFDPAMLTMNDNCSLQIFNIVFNELFKQKHNSLFAFIDSNDYQRNELLEALDFKRYN